MLKNKMMNTKIKNIENFLKNENPDSENRKTISGRLNEGFNYKLTIFSFINLIDKEKIK